VVSKSSVEYRAMVNATCELVWIRNLLSELYLLLQTLMRLYDNQAAIHICRKSCLSWAHQSHWGHVL